MGQTALLPFRRKACWGFFFALRKPTASAGFEPANLGTKGQHATSRPSKPMRRKYRQGKDVKEELKKKNKEKRKAKQNTTCRCCHPTHTVHRTPAFYCTLSVFIIAIELRKCSFNESSSGGSKLCNFDDVDFQLELYNTVDWLPHPFTNTLICCYSWGFPH